MHRMTEPVAASDVVTGSLAGGTGAAIIGLTAPLPLLLVGFLFSLVGGCVGMAVSPPQERIGILYTLLVAGFMGLLVAYLQPHLGGVSVFGMFTIPEALGHHGMLPFVMGGTGLISRWLARRVVRGDFTLPKFGRGASNE